jgi:hypothetical protein
MAFTYQFRIDINHYSSIRFLVYTRQRYKRSPLMMSDGNVLHAFTATANATKIAVVFILKVDNTTLRSLTKESSHLLPGFKSCCFNTKFLVLNLYEAVV